MTIVYRPTPRVVCPVPLGTAFGLGEELPIRARDDLDPCAPPLEYADGRISWSGYSSREERDAARVAEVERKRLENEARTRRVEGLLAEERTRLRAATRARVAGCSGHVVISEGQDYGFTAPVAVAPYTEENPAAHGNISRTQTCRCGAERQILINGRHHEVSPWRAPA